MPYLVSSHSIWYSVGWGRHNQTFLAGSFTWLAVSAGCGLGAQLGCLGGDGGQVSPIRAPHSRMTALHKQVFQHRLQPTLWPQILYISRTCKIHSPPKFSSLHHIRLGEQDLTVSKAREWTRLLSSKRRTKHPLTENLGMCPSLESGDGELCQLC